MSIRTWTAKLRRLMPIVAIPLLVSIGVPTAVAITSATPAMANTLNYPWPTDTQAPCKFGSAGGSSCTNPSNPSDKYDWGIYDTNHVFHPYRSGYEYRNCTDYVQWKESTIGVTVPSNWGNGGQWYDNAPASERSTTPKAWDAAVVPGNPGHVAFVESVNSDGTITVSEYNHNQDGTGDTRIGTSALMGFTEFIDFGVHPAGNEGGSSPVAGSSSSNSSVTLNPNNGEVYGFAIGSNGHLYNRSHLSGWSSWQDLGSPGVSLAGSPSATLNPNNGEVYAFAIGTNGHLYDISHLSGWSSWQDLGNGGSSFGGNPGVTLYPNNGEVYAFAIGTNGHLYDISHLSGWSSWQDLGSPGVSLAGSPGVTLDPSSGEVYGFATGSTGVLYSISHLSGWSSWQSLGNDGTSFIGSPGVAINPSDGEVYASTIGSNGHLYDISHLSGWSSWQDLSNGGVSLTG